MKANETLNRMRPLIIWEILQRETDEDHPMGTEELREKLREKGIDAHRTTVYNDIKLLNECGYEVLSHRRRSNQYYVMERVLSAPEIHILLDAVQAASFITHKKTTKLVDKIANLAGSQKAAVLKKNIVQFNTAKSSNEHIYYNVDTIISAINKRRKIRFTYFDYDNNHKPVYRAPNGDKNYILSPYATVFDDGHYYLVVYDETHNSMANYRIDRMDTVDITEEPADMPPKNMRFDIAKYKKSLFGMFSGETAEVRIEAHSSLINAIYDLFGENTTIITCDNETVTFTVEVQLSALFFGWCCSFGDRVKVVAPDSIVEQLKTYIDTVKGLYEQK